MSQVTGAIVRYPARASLFWYLGLILAGAALLWLPMSRGAGTKPQSPLDALFTATSAVCVTGLSVRSTEKDYSLAGQLVVLALIQLGGLGIMTVTTWTTLQLGGQARLRHRMTISETLGAQRDVDLRWVLGQVLRFTLYCEGAGFVALAARNLLDPEPWTSDLWRALFHSVSAFCNAGFALHDDSLTRYQNDPWVNGVISLMVIAGGLGYPVLIDLNRRLWSEAGASSTARERWDRLHLHTKTMLLGTAALLAGGTLAILILEWSGSFASLGWSAKLQAAWFQSMSCRTAGFNTVDIARLSNATLFLMILLMFVGAGPCSTAGGLKVSTALALVYGAWSTYWGRPRVNVFRRTVPTATFERAGSLALLFSSVAVVGLTTLLAVEQSGFAASAKHTFLDAAFEVVSALCTVGLTTGLTPDLTTPGRIIIITLMLIGRLGPITVFVALSREEQATGLEFPQEEPLLG